MRRDTSHLDLSDFVADDYLLADAKGALVFVCLDFITVSWYGMVWYGMVWRCPLYVVIVLCYTCFFHWKQNDYMMFH